MDTVTAFTDDAIKLPDPRLAGVAHFKSATRHEAAISDREDEGPEDVLVVWCKGTVDKDAVLVS